MSASHSVVPRPPRNPKRRSSGYSNSNKQPLQVRTTTKPKAPSLSHVINHLNESPKPELKSFLSLDSAITPKASSSRRVSVAASTMSTTSMYSPPIELPPLRLEGLLGSQGSGDGSQESPSSASSGMPTPTLSAGTSAMTTPSSASTMKNRVVGGDDEPPEAGTSRPSSWASSAASPVILTPTSIVGSGLWELDSKWRDSWLGAKGLDLTLGDAPKVADGEQGEEKFLEEVDQWLVYISKRIRQLEKKHKQSRSSEVGDSAGAGDVRTVAQDDERYSDVLASGAYHFL